MLILHTAHTYPPENSGVSRVASEIAARLARMGHEVHVATGRGREARDKELVEGVHVHRFGVSGNAVTGIRGEVARYARFVAEGPWEVLVMHCAQSWSTDALLQHLESLRAAKVFVGHGFSALGWTAYADYFEYLASRLECVDATVALSDLLEEPRFCAEHGLPAARIIPNGVDPEEFSAPPLDVRGAWGIGSRPWLISVSNHSPVKGHSEFFEVIGRVRGAIRESVGTIVGDPYPAARLGLGRVGVSGGCWYLCRARAVLEKGVDLRTGLTRREVTSAIRQADVVLVTSKREASPLVVLESMAARRPWVSFDVGCVKEHAGGVVVGSIEEMSEAVVALMRDRSARESLGRDGQSRISPQHTWDAIAAQHERLYGEIRRHGGD